MQGAKAQPIIFGGSSHPALAREIADLANIPLGKIHLQAFPDGELYVEILEPVAGQDVYVLQSLGFDPNVNLMELLLIIDAIKRAGAASITAILPYYAYARQDRIDKPGTAISAKLIANLLTVAGVNRVITMDLHSEQIEGFFDFPVEHLLTRTLMIPYCASLKLDDAVVVAPDKGGIKIASAYAKELDLPIALIDKVRVDSFRVEMHLFIGEVAGRTVILPDDMCSTGGTLISAAEECARLGARRIIALAGHGLFTGQALEKIERSPIEMVITTNSVPTKDKVRKNPKVKVISVASLFAKAIS